MTQLSGPRARMFTVMTCEEREIDLFTIAIIEAVKTWLDRHRNWLLVLDNAPGPDEVHDYLPQAATGHVLITSRDTSWIGVARPLPVQEFPRDQSVEFLLKRTGQSDEAAADTLAAALGDLPLALDQAGAYIEETGTTLADYQDLFRVRSGELLSRGQPPGYQDCTRLGPMMTTAPSACNGSTNISISSGSSRTREARMPAASR